MTRHIIFYGALTLSLLAAIWYIHDKGYKAAERDMQANAFVEQTRQIKERGVIEHETQSMERITVINDLRDNGELRAKDDY